MNLCECGCGREVKNRFVKSHHNRLYRKGKNYNEQYGQKRANEIKMKQLVKKKNKPGKPWSLETRLKLKGKVGGWSKGLTKETNENLKKMSQNCTGSKNHFFGKTHTEEAKTIIKEKRKNQVFTEERNLKVSLAHRGEKSPLWMGGIDKAPYSADFNYQIKRRIKKRDNYTCQICGYVLQRKQGGEILMDLHVHHIDYNKQNNVDENLITLCNRCHTTTNWDRKDWENHFNQRRMSLT